MIWVLNMVFSIFVELHRGFRGVFRIFRCPFRIFFWRRCVSQGNSPSFGIICFAPFAFQNLPISVFMEYHRGFRGVFTRLRCRFRGFFWRRCVSQGNSPSFGIVAFAPFAFPNLPISVFMEYHRGFRGVCTRFRCPFRGFFWRRCV